MKAIVIHFKDSTAKHIQPMALRSTIRLFVTCKVCQRKHWPSITRRVVS